MFATFKDFIQGSKERIGENIKTCIKYRATFILRNFVLKTFSGAEVEKFDCILNPWDAKLIVGALCTIEERQIHWLLFWNFLIKTFPKMPLPTFCISVQNDCKKAKSWLNPFWYPIWWQSAFSLVAVMMGKYIDKRRTWKENWEWLPPKWKANVSNRTCKARPPY